MEHNLSESRVSSARQEILRILGNNPMFIAFFMRYHHLSQWSARWNNPTSWSCISLSHLCLDLPSALFPPAFLTKLCMHALRATCPIQKVSASDYGMARPQVPDEGDGPSVWRAAGSTLNQLSQLYNSSPIYRLTFRLYTPFLLLIYNRDKGF